MKLNTEKGRVLITTIEEIIKNLDKTIFSSFKKEQYVKEKRFWKHWKDNKKPTKTMTK